MKKLETEMEKSLERDCYTLATCWVLTTKANKKIGFTDHVDEIIEDDFIYHSGSGFGSSSIESSIDISSSKVEVNGVLESSILKKDEIISGVYDNSHIEIFILDYTNPKSGKIKIKSGYLGEIKFSGDRFVADVNSIADNMRTNISKIYSPECRAEFGDSFCKFKKPTQIQGKVSSIKNNLKIISESIDIKDNVYSFGHLTFATGDNKDERRSVLECRGNYIVLKKHFSRPVNVGDEFVLYSGCDKTFETCSKKYNNALNFRGEPHLMQIEDINAFS